MFNQKMKQIQVLKQTTTKGSYNEDLTSWTQDKTIDGLLFTRNSTNVYNQNMKYSTSTHLCLTADKAITKENRLFIDNQEFQIDGIIPDGKFNQIFLTLIEGV